MVEVSFKEILEALAGIGTWLQGARKGSLTSLKSLADKKFEEMDQTHRHFLELLDRLAKDVKGAAQALDKTDDVDGMLKTLERQVEVVAEARRRKRPDRQANYEESRVYANNPVDPKGVLKTINDSVAEQLMRFTGECARYFETEDGYYRHELALRLSAIERTLYRLRQGLAEGETTKSQLVEALQACEGKILLSEEILSTRWRIVALHYHLLGLEFRERGVL
jgi:hypothetical protein